MERKDYLKNTLTKVLAFLIFISATLIINVIIYRSGNGVASFRAVNTVISKDIFWELFSPKDDINMQALWIISLITALPGSVFIAASETKIRKVKMFFIFLPISILLNWLIFHIVGANGALVSYFGGGFSLAGFFLFYMALSSGPAVYLSLAE